jgi:hypothetical protein
VARGSTIQNPSDITPKSSTTNTGTRVTKENSLSYLEAKSFMNVVAVVSGPFGSFFFFFLSGQ